MYQPLAFSGKGRAAICIGNPDTSPNTAVLVPGASEGVNNSDQSSQGWFVGQSDQAQNLYVESNRADPQHPTAVVAWMGYDSPSDGDTAVLSRNLDAERSGGSLLAHDVSGLWATHQGSSHLTVVGYSTGATVATDAATTDHLHANDMVLLGPISTDQAHSAADLHLSGGHVYVGEASDDLPARAAHDYLGGPDPTAPGFGAIRIQAETPPGSTLPIIGMLNTDHEQYFDAGSESLYATTDITSGNADELAADHMLVPESSRSAPQALPRVPPSSSPKGSTQLPTPAPQQAPTPAGSERDGYFH